MKKFFSLITGGILMILMGIALYISRSVYGYSVTPFVGVFIVVCGSIWIVYIISIRKKVIQNSFEQHENEKIYKCPECRMLFSKSDMFNKHDPNCKGKPEELNGFFDRHPELLKETKSIVKK